MNVKDQDNIDKLKLFCAICTKHLTNSCKLQLLKKCGHVFCQNCLQMNSASTLKKKESKLDKDNGQCFCCSKAYDTHLDIVSLQACATGFASNH